jgi:hypothetical protein
MKIKTICFDIDNVICKTNELKLSIKHTIVALILFYIQQGIWGGLKEILQR